MKRLLVLVAAAILITSAAAQDAKITGNRWASDALIVSGTLSNPNGWPVEFVGFDKDQKIVTRNNYYETQPDGTFRTTLSDPKKEIKFVKVEFVSAATASTRTREAEIQATPIPVIASVTQVDSGNAFAGFVLIAFIFMAYFTPTMIAACRKHRNATAIFLVNFFFGWSVLGWLIALVWSATANVTPPKAVAVTPS